MDWPADDKPIMLDELVSTLRDTFQSAFKIKRIPGPIAFNGPDKRTATALKPSEQLSEDGLRRSREQGSDALDAILTVALQLGIEQGKRIERRMRTEGKR